MKVCSSNLTTGEVIFIKSKVKNFAAQHGNVLPNSQRRLSAKRTADFPLHSLFVGGWAQLVLQQQTEQKTKWVAASWRTATRGRRASLCIDADDEYMEKRASEGKEPRGWMSCWQALNVQLSHITLHHTLCPHHTLCSQDVELLFCTLCIGNEVGSGEAAMWPYVTLCDKSS